MKSRVEHNNERNSPFGAVNRPLETAKPGIESVKPGDEVKEEGQVRITPSSAEAIPQVSLADRIREQEERK